jgi:hypothetical protein
MSQQILAPTTAAAATAPFTVASDYQVTAMVQPVLAGIEEAQLQISPDQGVTWVNAIIPLSPALLNVSNSILYVRTPGIYRFNKTATAAPTAVFVATEINQ